MIRVKLTAYVLWVLGLVDEWLTKLNWRRGFANSFHSEVANATGRRVRVLMEPPGNFLFSHYCLFLIRRFVRTALGPSFEVVLARKSLDFPDSEALRDVVARHNRVQQFLADKSCDVLISWSLEPGKWRGLRLISNEAESGKRYSQALKFALPIVFSRSSKGIIAARVFAAASKALYIPPDLCAPIMKQLISKIGADSTAPNLRMSTLINHAFLLRYLGERGDAAALESAAQLYESSLHEIDHLNSLFDYAALQADLGAVLWQIGETEGNESRSLQRARAALEASLSQMALKARPLLGASTQDQLGLTLLTLAARKQVDCLEQAITAFVAAKEYFSPELAPLDWSYIQLNIGRAQLLLYQQSNDVQHLTRAIDVLRHLLRVVQNEPRAELRSTAQQMLGNALIRLSERTDGTVELHGAVKAFKAAAEIRNRHLFPKHWVTLKTSLGVTLTTIGIREREASYLQEAIKEYRDQLNVFSQAKAPMQRADAQYGIAVTLLHLFQLNKNVTMLEEAIAAFQASLQDGMPHRKPLQRASAYQQLGNALMQLSSIDGHFATAQLASEAYRNSLDIYEKSESVISERVRKQLQMANIKVSRLTPPVAPIAAPGNDH